MNTGTSTVTIHMVSSLDGFIAATDGSVAWMQSTDNYGKGTTLSDEDITDFLNSIDCYVMGSRTYEDAVALGWPYGDKPVFVVTNRNLISERKTVEFCQGDLQALVNDRLKSAYNTIWMVGGAQLTKDFLRLNLADTIVISILPVLLGSGTLFFDYIGHEQKLHLTDVRAYTDGMVELSYEIPKK